MKISKYQGQVLFLGASLVYKIVAFKVKFVAIFMVKSGEILELRKSHNSQMCLGMGMNHGFDFPLGHELSLFTLMNQS